ncbi:group II intron maturase-specific domain-containing protein [Nocardia sp. NPDC059239]|uniref:group II intron maturase-specific domain-containing protein n=1 Tax=Nocardia sp. NPDC059239 TaxID=3346785 RepID=UPI0036B3428C
MRGWMAYYGGFYPSALNPVLRRINTYLLRWIMSKYNKHSDWKSECWLTQLSTGRGTSRTGPG